MSAYRTLEELNVALGDRSSNAVAGNAIQFGRDREINVGYDGTNNRLTFKQKTAGTGEIEFDAPIRVDYQSTGAAAASGLLFGGGTSADPITTSTADAKFIELRCETTASSGDNRLQYLRYALEGGGGGECLRALTVVGSNLGTAHGAHLSLTFEATAGGSECSGLGVAVRGTLHIPDIASWAPTGTYSAGMLEIYSDGTASDPAGMTELSYLRISNSGGTGKADVDDDAFLLSLQGFTAGAAKTLSTGLTAATVNAATTVAMKIKIGAVTHWLPLATAIT